MLPFSFAVSLRFRLLKRDLRIPAAFERRVDLWKLFDQIHAELTRVLFVDRESHMAGIVFYLRDPGSIESLPNRGANGFGAPLRRSFENKGESFFRSFLRKPAAADDASRPG